MRRLLQVLFAASFLTLPFPACGNTESRIDARIALALDGKPRQAEQAVRELREIGPNALAELLDVRVELLSTSNHDAGTDQKLERLEEVIDRVGGQKYCSTSGLYWHVDLEEAESAARASGRPILSLRLLGNLTDEFSCANSRFFRTTLYANKVISKKLRDEFVLHWKSVRPVPKVTIDFGDGRKLERTLTGNSIHYILDAKGQTIDALPGLFGPAAFVERLDSGSCGMECVFTNR